MPLPLSPDSLWLFTGDSITDYNRSMDPAGWGYGYVRIIAQWLNARAARPGNTVPKIFNRATSGNTVMNLRERWEEDVLALSPNVVSIKIGTNDVWAGLGTEHPERAVPLEKFIEVYDGCLTVLRSRHSECRIILCDPCGIWPPAPSQGNACLQPYIDAVRHLATKHHVYAHIPLHQVFQDAMMQFPDVDFLADGVHPTPPGDMLIATAWMRAVGLLSRTH